MTTLNNNSHPIDYWLTEIVPAHQLQLLGGTTAAREIVVSTIRDTLEKLTQQAPPQRRGLKRDGTVDRRTLRLVRPRDEFERKCVAVSVSPILPPRSRNVKAKGHRFVTLGCGTTVTWAATNGNPQVGRAYKCPTCTASARVRASAQTRAKQGPG